MSKHIFLCTDDPGVGGVAQYNHLILCGLLRLGYRVTCVQSGASNNLTTDQDTLGVQPHQWIKTNTVEDCQRILANPTAQADLIICSNSNPFSNFTVKQIAIQFGIPYIVVEGLVDPHLAERFSAYLDELSHHYTQAKSVIAVSWDNLSLLHKLFKLHINQGQVIYYGRPSEYFTPCAPSIRNHLRQALSIPSYAVVCFTAARIETRKGYQYQLEAIKQLMQSSMWPQLYFVWAGAGIFEPQLETQLQKAVEQLGLTDKVMFLGQRSDVSAWLSAADIFVFPSQLEGMPLCVMEAMAKGLPVIATAVSGIPEELGDTGKLLSDPKIDSQATVRELVTAIQDWTMSPELRHSIGQACKQRAEDMFREERMIGETVEVIERALLPAGDYVSPGLSIIQPDQSFHNMIVGDTKTCVWPYLRREIPHNWYVDKRQPGVGFLSRDEAHILYNIALKFKGKRALEIGCWLGWSACHLALAGVELDVIDPLLAKTEFYESVNNSLKASGVLDTVNLIAGYSPQKVEELASQFQRKWSLIFIDGNHESPGPLNDAIICEQLAEADALIVFHDLASPDVAQGLHYFKQKGWQTMVYQTMQIMGVAWRGNVEPVRHQPDPKINWFLPTHLQNYIVSGMSNNQSVNEDARVRQVQEMMQQAVAFLNSSKQVDAMRIAEEAASLGINVPGIHYLRSVCLCNVARHKEALEAAKAELAINPMHCQAQDQVKALTKVLSKPELKIPTEQRMWNTTLPRETMLSIQNASHNYSYRGVPMIKNPFDFALYPLLIWNLKPRTIIEIGSKDGGSALWLGDMLNNFGIDGHIYSIDIVKVTSLQHPCVTFMEGDGRALQKTLTPDFLKTLPRPLLVIEDADHVYETSRHVLDFFHPYLMQGEYLIVEDGIISDLIQDTSYNSGPHKALKEFFSKHKGEYEIDGSYCDYFGYNITWCTNGFIKKIINLSTADSATTVLDSKREEKVQENLATVQPYTTLGEDIVKPTIIVDGVFFQLNNTGIARVWRSLLEEWAENGFVKHIVVLDRAGTSPKIPGIRYCPMPPYDYSKTDADREMLQQVCDEEGADLFVSTYYTTPLSTPSVFMAYDMIPEVMGADLSNPMWKEKHYAIQHASAYITISDNTARDLVKFFPHISLESVTVALCGVKRSFLPASLEEINSFRTKYGISKPYFILSGAEDYHKNAILFLKAFAQLYNSGGFEIVCTGRSSLLEAEFIRYTPGSVVHMLQLSDEELSTAYSGAVALVYPSKYEGFGLPALEAIACGCPVITCPNASIPEVVGEAALYVNDEDVEGLANALYEIQKPNVRNSLSAAGLQQAKKFSWSKMAKAVSSALIDVTLLELNLKDINLIVFPDWSQPEESLCLDLEKVIRAIATLPKSSQITLLVDTGNISDDDADLILSSVNMNLLMQEDLEFPEGLEISIVSHLDAIQWQTLLPRIHTRIVLENENKEAITLRKAENIPACELEILNYEQAIQPEREMFKFDLTRVPQWLLDDYLKVMLAPSYFHEIGEADKYYHYMEQCVNYLHSSIVSNPESNLSKKVAATFTTKANFIPLYFNNSPLKNIYVKRADMIEFFLKTSGHQIDYIFPVNTLERTKIRIGILAAHFAPQTETFATLPVYKHLNRDLFEIILYTIRWSNHRLERYCSGHADAVVNLPEDLPSQVQTIRDGDLDILFISTNVTAVTYSTTLLALHRLARVQMVGMNSPVTTGMRNVDYYISSKLIKCEHDAEQHYTEKLITLDSPAQCFDFATEEQQVVTNNSSRESLGIDKKTIIYISGANFYKIIPELQVAWAKIIKGVTNSKLVLYPFNPNWSNSYPVDSFRDHLTTTFARQGLSEDRLIVLEPVPNRADVKERLKLGDIYLDSYPYSGMTSLIDPLQLGLPTVAMEGNSSRSRMGASLLRELQIPDLISDSEESYIQLAIALGTDPELRKQKSDQIKRRMRANPGFLDSRSYSAQMGTLFQELFRKHQAIALVDSFKLRATNLIIFPDWSQPEDILYQDLASVITNLVNHPDKNQMTLLINTGNLSEDEANLLLSDIVMNLLLEEDLDVANGPEISLLGQLGEMQWEALLPQIQARIVLEKAQQAMSITGTTTCAAVKVENIPVLMIDGIIHKDNSDDTTKASY